MTGQLAATDGPDTASITVEGNASVTSASLAIVEASDTVAISAEATTPAGIAATDSPDAASITVAETIQPSSIIYGGDDAPPAKRRKRIKRIDEMVMDWVDHLFDEPESAPLVAPKVAAIVQPFVIANEIDWKALRQEARKVSALIDLWERTAHEQELADDDEDALMMELL